MTVRTDQLANAAPALVMNVFQTVATVPAGEVWLIREYNVSHAVATPGDYTVRIWSGAALHRVAKWLNLVSATPATSSERYSVMVAGDTIELVSSQSGTAFILVTGSRLVTS